MKKVFLSLLFIVGLLNIAGYARPAFAVEPLIDTSKFEDQDYNGTVDHVRWTMNGLVTTCTYEPGDWTVNTAGTINIAVTNIGCTGIDNFLDIAVTATANRTGSATLPIISYNNADLNNSFIVSSGIPAAFPSVTATDGAAPRIYQADYHDDNDVGSPDGKIDDLVLSFTETVTGASTLALNDLSLTAGDFTGAAFGSSLTNLITGPASFVFAVLGTEATVVDTHQDGAMAITAQNGFSLTDGTNVNSTTGPLSNITFVDAAKPIISTISYRDVSADGGIMDTVRLTFSEPVDSTSVVREADVTITTDGDFNGFQFGSDTTDLIDSTVSSIDVEVTMAGGGSASSVRDTFDNSGTFAISTQNSFRLTDVTGVSNVSTGAQTQATVTDGAAPRIQSVYYEDSDGDGKMDRVYLLFTESVTSDSVVRNSTLTFSGVGGFTDADFGSETTDLIDVTKVSLYVLLGTESTAVITNVTGGPALDAIGDFVLTDGTNSTSAAGNLINLADNLDYMAPVVVSVTPASAATGVTASTNVAITFSEPMAPGFAYATEFTSLPNPGTWGAPVWTNGDKTVTLSHAAFTCGSTPYTITTVPAAIDAMGGNLTPLVTTGPQTGVWSFTTGACASSGGGSYNPPTPTYSIDLTTPTGTESLSVGQSLDLKWSTSGTGTANYVNLFYSTNDGSTWSTIAHNTANDGSYFWTVPTFAMTTAIKVKAESTDLVDALTSDISPSVNVVIASTTTQTPPRTTPVTAPVTSGFGPSPITGLPESISQVSVGQYIKGSSLPTVYYLDPNGTRRPFLNEQVYFTWATSFNQIVTVTDATLPTIPMGSPVIPRPGVVLVKIVSSPKVYAVEAGDTTSTKGILRWIPSESIAIGVYGADWSDYVIDIPDTLISRYTYGADLTSSDTKPAGMKKRATLHN